MKMSQGLLMTAVVLTLAMTGPLAEAQKMYKWTDENGVVHFSATPPPGEEVESTEVPPGAEKLGQDPSTLAPASDMPNEAQQRRDELAQKRDQARAESQAREAQCAAKRAEVERLEPHRRVFYTDENGETVRMDDQVRVDRVAAAKQFIQENCN
jgi:hypothetical protein